MDANYYEVMYDARRRVLEQFNLPAHVLRGEPRNYGAEKVCGAPAREMFALMLERIRNPLTATP